MKALRDTEISPPDYAAGDRVKILRQWMGSGNGVSPFGRLESEFVYGEILSVGISQFDKAYDYYTIRLTNGEIIELWWMTGYSIIHKVSPEASGLLFQEQPTPQA
jgi:hypothetical protein